MSLVFEGYKILYPSIFINRSVSINVLIKINIYNRLHVLLFVASQVAHHGLLDLFTTFAI